MAKKRKRDFWDDIDEDVVPQEESKQQMNSARNQGEYTQFDGENEGFKLTKSMPAKVIARLLLCVAAVIIGVSGYICYKYVDDRYTDGTYSTSYFDSNGFSREYNDSINKLIKLLQAVESEEGVTPERITEMAASIMGDSNNFTYLVLNENQERVLTSGDDAKERIESSNHFLRVSTLDNDFKVETGVPTAALNKTSWQRSLNECANAYNIYTAVDNNLQAKGSFYESYLDYQKLTDYFGKAKIFGIAALVVFIILLVFCVMSTGMYPGNDSVRLGWFDKVFTEPAAIVLAAIVGGLIYGLFYLTKNEMKFGTYLKAADAFLIYVFLIRGYFSLVRRIKSGTFITNSLIYKACHGINVQLSKLPKAVKVIIILLFLIALNGGLVYALLYMRDYTVGSIPMIFIVAPIVFIIELIAFVSCIFGIGEDYEEYYDDEDEDAVPENRHIEEKEDQSWEDVDFSKDIKEADEGQFEDHSQVSEGATQENIHTKTTDKTIVLSHEERQQVLNSLGFGETQMLDTEAIRAAESASKRVRAVKLDEQLPKQPKPEAKPTEVKKVEVKKAEAPVSPDEEKSEVTMENTLIMEPLNGADEIKAPGISETVHEKTEQELAEELGLVDFIQLNKDVRKLFRLKLKARTLGVTLRAPERPIYLDIDKTNAIKVLSILFDNIEKYAEEGTRVYIEMYAQNGKMIYLMKNTIREDLLEQTTNAMGPGLMEAKRIVQSEKGKFINNVEGETYKVGILLDVSDPYQI